MSGAGTASGASGRRDEFAGGREDNRARPGWRDALRVLGRADSTVLFVAVVAIEVATVWVFREFLSMDGPAHVGGAGIITHYDDPAYGVFRRYFTIVWRPVPNMPDHMILAGLSYVVSPSVAQKLLASLCIVLFAAGARYAMTAYPAGGFASLLALPFAVNTFLYWGFYNFCLGLGMFFLAVGYYLRRPDRLGPRQVATLALLVLATYFCHLVPMMMTLVFMGVDLVWRFFLARRRPGAKLTASADTGGSTRVVLWRGLAVVVAALPAVGFALWYLVAAPPDDSQARNSAPRTAASTLTLRWALVLWHRELPVTFAISLVMLLVCAYVLLRRRRTRGRLEVGDAWLVAASVVVVLLLVAPPAAAGGALVIERLSMFPFFALLLWAATQDVPLRARTAAATAMVLLLAVLVSLRLANQRTQDRQLGEYLAASQVIRSNSTVLPLYFSLDSASPAPRPVLYALGYVTAHRPVVDLSFYEGFFYYFPVQFRPAVNPLEHFTFDDLSTPPRNIDILSYERKTGGSVDYVLLWGLRQAPDDVQRSRDTRHILDQLGAGYRSVYDSPTIQIYARTGGTG